MNKYTWTEISWDYIIWSALGHVFYPGQCLPYRDLNLSGWSLCPSTIRAVNKWLQATNRLGVQPPHLQPCSTMINCIGLTWPKTSSTKTDSGWLVAKEENFDCILKDWAELLDAWYQACNFHLPSRFSSSDFRSPVRSSTQSSSLVSRRELCSAVSHSTTDDSDDDDDDDIDATLKRVYVGRLPDDCCKSDLLDLFEWVLSVFNLVVAAEVWLDQRVLCNC